MPGDPFQNEVRVAEIRANRQLALPFGKHLDARPEALAIAEPFDKAANIPLEGIEKRTHELPSKGERVSVVGPDVYANPMVEFLRSIGRLASHSRGFPWVNRCEAWTRYRLWKPNEWLEWWLRAAMAKGLTAGRALDLGCGSGRDAVFATAQDWRVDAVDVLPDSLERGQDLASRYLTTEQAFRIYWQQADVLKNQWQPRQQYDLIFGFFFFDRSLIERTKAWLKPGGTMLIEAFTTIRQAEHGKPASSERVVAPGELKELLSAFEMVKYLEGEHPHGHTARAWVRAKS